MTRSRPRRSLRTRLALLYGALIFASGTALLAFADAGLLGMRSTAHTAPVPTGTVQPAPHPVVTQTGGPHVRQLIAYSAVALAVVLVLSVVLGWVIAGRVLRPFQTIIATARQISAHRLHERLSLAGSYDEFRELGDTLDDLFGRLEASFDAQRHFVANASHELRTPLTAERALLQVALADPDATTQTLRSTCEELLTLGERQERLIEGLLTLASGEGGIDRWEPFDLAQVAADVILARRAEALRRAVRVDATLTATPAAGDPSLVESLVANLVDNALRHNGAGGQVEITTTAPNGRATIAVSNTGPAVPPDEIDRLFQPFQRLGDDRVRHTGGHGLGLTIVRAVAHAHGATLTAQARPKGGLDITVSFPGPNSGR